MLPSAHLEATWDWDDFSCTVDESLYTDVVEDTAMTVSTSASTLEYVTKKRDTIEEKKEIVKGIMTPIDYTVSLDRMDLSLPDIVIDGRIILTQESKHVIFLKSLISNRSIDCPTDRLETMINYITKVSIRATATQTKPVISLEMAQGRTKSAVDFFLKHTNHVELWDIHRYIKQTKLSGRTIDLFLTTIANSRELCYYLAPSDTDVNQKIITDDTEHSIKFNLGLSYKETLKIHTKQFFDCFGRGQVFVVNTEQGPIQVPICQFIFFKWAKYNCVIEFIEKLIKQNDDKGMSRFTTPHIRGILEGKKDEPTQTTAKIIKTTPLVLRQLDLIIYVPCCT